MKKVIFWKFISGILIVNLVYSSIMPYQAFAQSMGNLPAPGAMLQLSAQYMPATIKGLKVYPENPLLFDFLIDTGKSGFKADSVQLKDEANKLIKYFLAALTIKEDDLWVNLSPYEKDRMIAPELGKTELGRDMLAQDYILKQLTASLIYPEKALGSEFWKKVYAQAKEKFGTTDIQVDTFNKIWIVADKAKVLERNNAAYVVGAHLKVMLESDYVAEQANRMPTGGHVAPQGYVSPSTLPSDAALNVKALQVNHPSPNAELTKQILREIVVPAIEKEVNDGAHFAPLRQMYYSMILASWYKIAVKDALLNQVYSNKAKTDGVESDDPQVKEKIYQQYLAAFKQGVFNFIKEETDTQSGEIIPRKYFSGGEEMGLIPGKSLFIEKFDDAMVIDSSMLSGNDMVMVSTDMRRADLRQKKSIIAVSGGLNIGFIAGKVVQRITLQTLYNASHGNPRAMDTLSAFLMRTKFPGVSEAHVFTAQDIHQIAVKASERALWLNARKWVKNKPEILLDFSRKVYDLEVNANNLSMALDKGNEAIRDMLRSVFDSTLKEKNVKEPSFVVAKDEFIEILQEIYNKFKHLDKLQLPGGSIFIDYSDNKILKRIAGGESKELASFTRKNYKNKYMEMMTIKLNDTSSIIINSSNLFSGKTVVESEVNVVLRQKDNPTRSIYVGRGVIKYQNYEISSGIGSFVLRPNIDHDVYKIVTTLLKMPADKVMYRDQAQDSLYAAEMTMRAEIFPDGSSISVGNGKILITSAFGKEITATYPPDYGNYVKTMQSDYGWVVAFSSWVIMFDRDGKIKKEVRVDENDYGPVQDIKTLEGVGWLVETYDGFVLLGANWRVITRQRTGTSVDVEKVPGEGWRLRFGATSMKVNFEFTARFEDGDRSMVSNKWIGDPQEIANLLAAVQGDDVVGNRVPVSWESFVDRKNAMDFLIGKIKKGLIDREALRSAYTIKLFLSSLKKHTPVQDGESGQLRYEDMYTLGQELMNTIEEYLKDNSMSNDKRTVELLEQGFSGIGSTNGHMRSFQLNDRVHEMRVEYLPGAVSGKYKVEIIKAGTQELVSPTYYIDVTGSVNSLAFNDFKDALIKEINARKGLASLQVKIDAAMVGKVSGIDVNGPVETLREELELLVISLIQDNKFTSRVAPNLDRIKDLLSGHGIYRGDIYQLPQDALILSVQDLLNLPHPDQDLKTGRLSRPELLLRWRTGISRLYEVVFNSTTIYVLQDAAQSNDAAMKYLSPEMNMVDARLMVVNTLTRFAENGSRRQDQFALQNDFLKFLRLHQDSIMALPKIVEGVLGDALGAYNIYYAQNKMEEAGIINSFIAGIDARIHRIGHSDKGITLDTLIDNNFMRNVLWDEVKGDVARGIIKRALDASQISDLVDGGIDLNAKNMALDVAKDGKGIAPFKLDPAMIADFQRGDFTGVTAMIIRIVPVSSPFPMLGLETPPLAGEKMVRHAQPVFKACIVMKQGLMFYARKENARVMGREVNFG